MTKSWKYAKNKKTKSKNGRTRVVGYRNLTDAEVSKKKRAARMPGYANCTDRGPKNHRIIGKLFGT